VSRLWRAGVLRLHALHPDVSFGTTTTAGNRGEIDDLARLPDRLVALLRSSGEPDVDRNRTAGAR
jgi:hypothetical protein